MKMRVELVITSDEGEELVKLAHTLICQALHNLEQRHGPRLLRAADILAEVMALTNDINMHTLCGGMLTAAAINGHDEQQAATRH